MILLIPFSFFVLLSIVYIYRKGDLSVRMSILAIVSIILPFIWPLVKLRWPETENIEYDLWLDPNFHEKFNVLWYIYGVGSYVAKVILSYVTARFAELHSFKAYKVFAVLTIYFVVQFGFWLWNKNTSAYANFIVYLFALPLIVYLLIPSSEDQAIIKSIE